MLRSLRSLLFIACLAGAGLRAAEPALVVVLMIDQFRADYLERFGPHFGPDGFRRLMVQGATFTDCRYRYAVTKTACGHATVLTGVNPNVHGIIANDWIERETLTRVNCVDDDTTQVVGLPDVKGGAKLPAKLSVRAASPRRLLATTVGDELKLDRGPGPKVIGVSSKDRSAVLLGGKLADAAYWMDKGRIVTSTAYMKELPAWVQAFNATGRIDSYFDKVWDRVLPAEAYVKLQGPDAAEGEGAEAGMGTTFPKRVNGGAAKLTSAFYDAFENSPFKSEVLVDFAREVVEHEKLGQRGVTDVLCLSFSTNDSVGHTYGPDSHEIMDITLRTDRMLADFLTFLDQRVGLQRCTIVFTADHGTAPLPERVKAMNPTISAGRVDSVRLLKTCEAALDTAFGPLAEGKRWLVPDANQFFFAAGVLAEKKVAPAAAEIVVRDAMRTVEFIDEAYTRTALLAGEVKGAYAEATLLSFNRERTGDVCYRLKPYWVERKTGTNHGTPYTYDVCVPLVWFGVGVKPGVYPQRVGVDDIAPTLARILHLLPPPRSEGRQLF